MLKQNLLLLFFCMLVIFSKAQEWNTSIPKRIVIVYSTKNYAAAKKIAEQAVVKMKKPLQIKGLSPNKKTGLTMSKQDCETFGYPCYIARGEGSAENSDYISIEYSSAYMDFKPGYYIVVAGIGDPDSEELKKIETQAKRFYKDAYSKLTKVWFGCMH